MFVRTLLFFAIASAALAQGDEGPTVVEIRTLRGQMKYDQDEIQVPAGAKIRLVLHNDDDMPHNLVICKPGEGIEQEVAHKAWELGGDGFNRHWIPQHPALLFASKMADPKNSVTLEFTAPEKPGIYPYVCTLPGHSMLMNGEMIVDGGGAAPGGSKNGLSELTFTLFEGEWDKLPDFSKLEPKGTDHVRGGLITLKVSKKIRDDFAVVFNGKLEAPADGKYKFKLSSDDGSRLIIDGETVIDHDGIHGTSSRDGSAELSKGSHDIEVQYFERRGHETLRLSWSGPGFKDLALSEDAPQKRNRKPAAGMELIPPEGEAIIYRNFIEGAGARAIGVGYPNGANLAFDADQCRLALVWQGSFIDAARHWTGRGQGFQPPLGYNVYPCVEGVPFARLESKDTPWPDTARKTSQQRPDNGYVFKGYRLVDSYAASKRIPEFRYRFEGGSVSDLPIPAGSPRDNDSRIERTISISTTKTEPPLYFRAATGNRIEILDDGRYEIDGKIRMAFSSASDLIIRDASGKKELLLPITFFTNGKAQFMQIYDWR